MTSQTRIAPAEFHGMHGAMIKWYAGRLLGRVPESIGVLWNHEAIMKDTVRFGQRVESWKELDPNLATYAVMASAAVIGCSWCLDFNYFMAHNHGLDETKVRQVPDWRNSKVFTPLERRVMEYAEAASQTPPVVTDALSDALLKDLGPAGMVELATRVGFMNMTARTNIALGIHSEQFADSCSLAPLASRTAPVDAA